MREFFLENGFLLVIAIALAETVLAVLLWKMYKEGKKIDVLCLALLCSGLVYDACIIAIGKFLPQGSMAVLISKVRYILSGLMIPLLLPIGAHALKLEGFKMKTVWVISIILMIPGAIGGCIEQLEVEEIAGLVRYASTSATPKWVSVINLIVMIGTVIALIAIGGIACAKQKNPYVLLAGLFMFGFSALGGMPGNTDLMFLLSMFGELLMVTFLWLHLKKE